MTQDTSSLGGDNEEVGKQVQLNLRISTAGDSSSMSSNHVTKVMIQNYASLISGDSLLSHQVEESLKLSLSNLKLEGYVQPLFRVEKMTDSTKKIWGEL